MKPFEQFLGDEKHLKTFMLVTFGQLEVYTSDAEVVAQILSRPKDFTQLEMGNWIVGIFSLWAGGSLMTSTDGRLRE